MRQWCGIKRMPGGWTRSGYSRPVNGNLCLTVAYVIMSHGKDVHYGNANCAMVWHYYKGTHTKPTVFEKLIRRASQEPLAA